MGELYMAVRGGASINEKQLSNFELEALFYSIDNNADGHITTTELCNFLNTKQAAAPKAPVAKPPRTSGGSSVPLSALKAGTRDSVGGASDAQAMLLSAYNRRGKHSKYGNHDAARKEEDTEQTDEWECADCMAGNSTKLLRCKSCRVARPIEVQLLGARNALRPTTSVVRGKQLHGNKFMRQVVQGMRVSHRLTGKHETIDGSLVMRRVAEARQACNTGRYREAVKMIERVLRDNVSLSRDTKCKLYIMQSNAESRNGLHWDAVYSAEHAIQQVPNSARALQRAGMAEIAVGRFEQATNYAAKALALEPANKRLVALYKSCSGRVPVDNRPFWKEDPTGRPTTDANGHHDGRKPWDERPVYQKAGHDYAPPPKTPFLLVRAPLDEEWKHMDLADIMKEQSILKNAIESAIEDGQVDEKELEFIMRSMRRVNMPKDKQKLIREALEDGEMDEDDAELLRSVCPPDPMLDWKDMMAYIEEEQGFIKMVFRYYCMEGSVGKAEGNSMTLVQFGKFAQAIQVIDGKLVNSGVADRIFLRANMDRSLENNDKVFQKRKGVKAVENKDNELVVHEFGAAVIRLAHARYRSVPSLAARLKLIVEENIKKHAMGDKVDDDFIYKLKEPEVETLVASFRDRMTRIFAKFAASDTRVNSGNASGTINMAEWLTLCEDGGIISPEFTVREARMIFVQVNLDDELYMQEDDENNADELVYDEFEECLCRVALELYPADKFSLTESIRKFLEEFLPVASKLKVSVK